MLELYDEILTNAESQGPDELRRLPLDDYALLLLNNTSSKLPFMPPEQIQKNWNGSSGLELLRQSVLNVRMFEGAYVRARNQALKGKRVLDIGCGWGRLARLFLKYTDDVFSIDPWFRSIEEFKACGLKTPVAQCDYLPSNFPFQNIDLAYAFSVFTHTSPTASETILRATRGSISDNGVFVFTVRPVEFWDFAPRHKENSIALKDEHRSHGYAYVPQPGNAGSAEYGDASISTDWLNKMLAKTGWRLHELDRSMIDPYQIFVVALPN